jgi:glycine cleavage system regulatory protein
MNVAVVNSSRNAWSGAMAEPEAQSGSPVEDNIRPPAKYHREFFTIALENPSEGRLITTLTCKVANNMLLVTVDGEECCGVLAFITKAFADFGVNIESCNGRRMKFTQGCYFELTHSRQNEERVRNMFDYLERNAGSQFRPKPVVIFDRVYDIKIDVLRDQTGLLSLMAELFARNNVNLRYFRADTEDHSGRQLEFATADEPEVEITAGLDLPVGLSWEWLREELQNVCPPDSVLNEALRKPCEDECKIVHG